MKQLLSTKRLLNALRYSSQGFIAACRHETAFVQELIVTIVLTPVAIHFGATPVQRVLLIGALLLVLIVELLNSAIEAVVDRISAEQHPLAGRAKDYGSLAVLLAIVNAVFVWVLLLL